MKMRSFAVILVALVLIAAAGLTAPKVYNEAPAFKALVQAGKLPAVEQRLPDEPMVVQVFDKIGKYGGELRDWAPANDEMDELWWARETYWFLPNATAPWYKGKTLVFPEIASGLDVSKDGKTFIVHLRKGLKWSDGQPFTADDSIFWYEDVAKNKELYPAFPSWAFGDRVPLQYVKVDDYTIKIVFEQQSYSFVDVMASCNSLQGIAFHEPKHYLKKWHIKYNPDADKLAKQEGYDNWYQCWWAHESPWRDQSDLNLPVLSPWILKSQSSSRAIFERNPYYFGVDPAGNQLPYIDRIVINPITDLEAAKLRMMAGEYDLQGFFVTSLRDYPLYKSSEAKGNYRLSLRPIPSGSDLTIGFNLNDKDAGLASMFQNVKFRQAVSLCINRDQINNLCYQGAATPGQCVVDPTASYYQDRWRTAYIKYDPAQADRLLNSIGMKRGADGWRVRPDGKRLELEIPFVAEIGGGVPVLTLVVKNLNDIGIKTSFRLIERGLWEERLLANDLPVSIWAEGEVSEGVYWGSQGTWGLKDGAQDWYAWITSDGKKGVKPPAWVLEYDGLCRQLASTLRGSSTYNSLERKIWDIRLSKLWVIGTVGRTPRPIIVKNGLGNVPSDKLPFLNSWRSSWVTQMYWEDEARRNN